MREIGFYVLVGTIALAFGFASQPRGFVAVGVVAAVAAIAELILLEGGRLTAMLTRAPRSGFGDAKVMRRGNEAVAVVLTALIAGILRILRKGRLVWSISHQHTFVVPVPALQPVYTRDVWVQNTGRGSVTDVEVVLNYPPQDYEIWPQREFQVTRNPGGRLVIKVASLGAREFFTIVMLSVGAELPLVTNVRSSDGMARTVKHGASANFLSAIS
jgi:hypothetical protein